MEYKILHNPEYNFTFLLEIECYDADDQAENGNIVIGELQFSGKAAKIEKLKIFLEKNGFDAQAFSAYNEQIATAVYNAASQRA